MFGRVLTSLTSCSVRRTYWNELSVASFSLSMELLKDMDMSRLPPTPKASDSSHIMHIVIFTRKRISISILPQSRQHR